MIQVIADAIWGWRWGKKTFTNHPAHEVPVRSRGVQAMAEEQRLDVVVSQTVSAAESTKTGFGFRASTTLEFDALSRENFNKFQSFSMQQGADAVAFAAKTFDIKAGA